MITIALKGRFGLTRTSIVDRAAGWDYVRTAALLSHTLSHSVTNVPKYYVPSTVSASRWPIRHAVRFPSGAVSKGTGLGSPGVTGTCINFQVVGIKSF